jgi:DNA modification methylase
VARALSLIVLYCIVLCNTMDGRGSIHDSVNGVPFSIHRADCLPWMDSRPANTVHAIVTDPPYGLREYTSDEKRKLREGRGGVWRIPPSFDGCERSPVPRFTVLTTKDRGALSAFFTAFAEKAFRLLVPGGHLFIASSPLLSHLVYLPLMEAGFEKRGEIIRLVQTLRGGDRPKNAHREFAGITVMPRSGWEPWGLFRKPCEGRVQDNLRKWKTGGLRRISGSSPFSDVIVSSPTRREERQIAPHPSLKPQSFMRQIVRASLPHGKGWYSIRSWAEALPSRRLPQWAMKASGLNWTRRSLARPNPRLQDWQRFL